MTLVSIIIPVFNRADIVGETIESVRAQVHEDWELILVDDGSTDNTFQVLEGFANIDARISCVRRPGHMLKGANACRNYGLELSRGTYVKWIDSDDILLSDALIVQVRVLEENPNLESVFAQSIFFNNATRQLEESWSRSIYSNNISWDYIRNDIRWATGAVLWRKSFFKSAPFHESLRNSQEWLMHGQQLLRLTSNQYKILDNVVYHIRRGNLRMSSSTSSNYYLHQAKARVLLLNSARGASTSKFKVELMKQAIIYFAHAMTKKLSGK